MERGASPVSPTPRSGVSESTRVAQPTVPGLEYERFFTNEGVDPFDEIEWDLRAAVIGIAGVICACAVGSDLHE